MYRFYPVLLMGKTDLFTQFYPTGFTQWVKLTMQTLHKTISSSDPLCTNYSLTHAANTHTSMHTYKYSVDAPNILATNADTAPDPEPTSTHTSGLQHTVHNVVTYIQQHNKYVVQNSIFRLSKITNFVQNSVQSSNFRPNLVQLLKGI